MGKNSLIIFVLVLWCFFGAEFTYAQNLSKVDSIEIELNKIKQRNSLFKIKDSIRAELLKSELNNVVNPNSKELEKYKNELLQIKKEDSLRLSQQREAVERLRKNAIPYPVRLYNQTLFNVYSGLGPFSAKERASSSQAEIQKLYEKKLYFKDSLKLQNTQEYINIVYQGSIITSVSKEDALWENATQDSLAKIYLNSINSGIEENRISHTFENTAIRWAMAIGIIASFVFVVYCMRKLVRWLTKKLLLKTGSDFDGFKIKNYQFLSPRKFRMILIKVIRYTHIILFLILSGIAISIIFSIFPATEHWAYMLMHWIKEPLKDLGISLYDYLPNLLRIVVVLVIGRYLDKLLKYFSIEIERGILKMRGFHRDWAKPTYHLLRICLIAFVIIMIFPYLPGSDTSAFRGISVFFGVLLSLGSSSAIANTIAGFIITYMRPFQIGDWIKVNDAIGEVIEKTALVTRLRTINNEDITVPNSMILTSKTTNYSSASADKCLIIPIDININFDVPHEKASELLIKAALQTKHIVTNPHPYVFKNKIQDTYISYQLNAFTKNPERMYFIISDLNENILKVFKENDIDLLSPRFYAKQHHVKISKDEN